MFILNFKEKDKKMKAKYLFILIFAITSISLAQKSTLQVLSKWKKYSDKENALYHCFLNQAVDILNTRTEETAELKTESDWLKRSKEVREKLEIGIGKFPQKTPLNAKIVGVIHKQDYRVEKIIFESQPKFYVPAVMYIPNKLEEKTAAVIYVSGHSKIAFRSSGYQHVCINLAKKGFVVLAFDPIGQGERLLYYNPKKGDSDISQNSSAHSYAGVQCFLAGSSLARYMIWDGIRAVDYLLSRPEVDPNRIGITGRSGGGTQSVITAAFDERIYAAAPECYVTSMRRLWESVAPQDAEQNIYNGLLNGIDFADWLEVRAPKPTLLITTTGDFFSIQGAMETEQKVKRVYHIFNKDKNFSRVESDVKHAGTKKNREACYAFFQKHLNVPGSAIDEDVDTFTPEELRITKTGQVSTALGGETVFSLNKKEAEKEIQKNISSRKDLSLHNQKVIKAAEKLSGYIKPLKLNDIVFRGRYNLDGYSIERYFITGDGKYPIPFLVYVPNNITASTIIYLNQEGKGKPNTKKNDISDEIREDIVELARQGHVVLSADLLGIGEMKQENTHPKIFGKEYGEFDQPNYFMGLQLGKSLIGIQAGDIQRLVLFIKQAKWFSKSRGIDAVAKGENISTALLHSAAFENNFSKIVLVKPLISYASVVLNKYYYCDGIPPFVPAALTAYDLPDLEAGLNKTKLLLINIQNQLYRSADDSIIDSQLGFVKKALGKNNFQIKKINEENKINEAVCDWVRN